MSLINSEIANEVIGYGISLGADFVDLFVEKTQSQNLVFKSSKVEDSQSGVQFGIGIRLISGHQSLYAYTNSTEKEELLRITKLLAAQIKSNPKDLVQLDFTNLNYPKIPVLGDKDVDAKHKIETFKNIDRALRSDHKTAQVILNFTQKKQLIEIFNSEGLYATEERPYIRLYHQLVMKDGEYQTIAGVGPGAIGGWDFIEGLNKEEMAENLLKQANTVLYAKSAPAGNMPVIIDNGFGGVIFHEACGHLLETTSVEKKASVFWDKMGEKIAHSAVTAVDDGTVDGAWGSLSIDDEGMPTQKTTLIENGILKRFISDRMGEIKTGHKRTGSGRRQNYKFAPASRMRNTYIAAGKNSFEEMIGSVSHGIYAKKMGGGSVDPSTGQFNFAVQEAYIIKDGKIMEPVKGATLIGTGPEIMSRISMVGSNLSLEAGMCGSVSGSIPTTVGQPAIKVDEILVGGEV